jgi:hypothetical protein
MNIDIWGLSCITSEGGALYAMKFHDSGTSHRRTFFLANRLVETTLNALKIYKLEAERVTGKEMVYVHTDNTPEFRSNLWAGFFNENSIIHIPTAPYSSALNGTAERSIRISITMVRAMLNDSKLPTRWWAEAWAFADYVENLLPSVRHPGMIPEERWTGSKQDIGHICIWGCVAYVHIPKEKGGSKLSNRGQKRRLIGIEGHGLYRVLILETNTVMRSRNVKFEKGLGHCTLTPEGEYLELGFLNNIITPAKEDTLASPTSMPIAIQTPSSHPIATQTPSSHPTSQPASHPRIIYPPPS